MSDKIDTFEAKYREKYGGSPAFRLTYSNIVRGPEGFAGYPPGGWAEETFVSHLNEAFRLGYRAALKERP